MENNEFHEKQVDISEIHPFISNVQCVRVKHKTRKTDLLYTMSFGFHVYIGCYLVMPNFIEYFYLEGA
jgi:hypothetical protein